MLKYYDVNEEVKIQCDVSQNGLGCVLLQSGQPVAFASKTMTETEQRYTQIEKGYLAIVFACEEFNHYILGRCANIQTEHKPLETIFKRSLLCAPKRLQRMLLRLQKYSLTVVYCAGPKLFLADFLSRAPIHAGKSNGPTEMFDSEFTIFHVNRLSRVFLSFENVNLCSDVGVTQAKPNLIRHETVNDENLNELRSVILHGWPDNKHNEPLCIRHYWGFRDELSVCDDDIFKGACTVVPKSVRHLILKRIHSSHLGAESCLRKARSILFWPQMSHDIKSFVSQCEVCNELKLALTKFSA